MSLNTCEEHDDAIVVWQYGNKCPFCEALKDKEAAESKLGDANDRIDELTAELGDANDRLEESQER